MRPPSPLGVPEMKQTPWRPQERGDGLVHGGRETQPGQWHIRVPRLCLRQSQGPRLPLPPLTFPKALSGHIRGLLLATAGSVAGRGVQRPPGLVRGRCPLPSQRVDVVPESTIPSL